jgi:hypothetical protein
VPCLTIALAAATKHSCSYIFPPARRLHPPPRPLHMHMHMHMHTRTHLDLIYRTFSLPPNTTYKSEPAGRWWRCTEAAAAARHSPTACCCMQRMELAAVSTDRDRRLTVDRSLWPVHLVLGADATVPSPPTSARGSRRRRRGGRLRAASHQQVLAREYVHEPTLSSACSVCLHAPRPCMALAPLQATQRIFSEE